MKYDIIVMFMIFSMLMPTASAGGYLPHNQTIVDQQIKHPLNDYSFTAWTKYPDSGSYVSHLTSNDGGTTTINQTGDGDFGYVYGFDFNDNGYANPHLSITIYFITQSDTIGRHFWFRIMKDIDNLWYSTVSTTYTTTGWENHSQSFYWNPYTDTNWTYSDFDNMMLMFYTYGSGNTVITEIGAILTIAQDTEIVLPTVYIYLIAQLVLLLINLIGYWKIPILGLFGAIGTLLLAPATLIGFGDYYLFAFVMILVNITLPVIGISKAIRS